MISANTTINNAIVSPVRHITARVELYNGSTLIDTFSHNDRLVSITVERVGEGKFFGFGICQKANINLIDKNRELSITTANSAKISFGVDGAYMSVLPTFYITEVNRDENTNALSITAYDALNSAAKHTAAELSINSYTIKELATECANIIGLQLAAIDLAAFNTSYPEGANLEGTETIRSLLTAIAEATQTIYYVDASGRIVFKRLDKSGAAAYTIDRESYFTLDSKTNRRLGAICHATELGDNVEASIAESGSTQYVRDNPLWDMREDIADLVNSALAAVGGLTINQFDCSWRGNYLVEIGDKLALTTKDNQTVYSYLIDDTISYDGTYSQETKWSYGDDDAETPANPTTLGDVLKQTYAKVDKANREIELVASESAANKSNISSLMINTDSIAASIQKVETNANDAIEDVKNDITTLNNRVSATMTAEEVKLEISNELANGTTKVITNTGYSFNDEGLTVSKSDSEMKTTITDDGMIVFKNDEAMLTANNVGVDAVNLHATTYLIIGTNSRFEDFGSNRTGCFWIGEVY